MSQFVNGYYQRLFTGSSFPTSVTRSTYCWNVDLGRFLGGLSNLVMLRDTYLETSSGLERDGEGTDGTTTERGTST